MLSWEYFLNIKEINMPGPNKFSLVGENFILGKRVRPTGIATPRCEGGVWLRLYAAVRSELY